MGFQFLGGDLIFSHSRCSRILIFLPGPRHLHCRFSSHPLLPSFTDLDSDHLSPPPPPALHRLHSTSTTAAVSPSTGRVGVPISPSTRLPTVSPSTTTPTTTTTAGVSPSTTVPISPPSRLPIPAVCSGNFSLSPAIAAIVVRFSLSQRLSCNDCCPIFFILVPIPDCW